MSNSSGFVPGRGARTAARVCRALVKRGHACGRHRIARLMREIYPAARRKKLPLHDRLNHRFPIAPNLLQRHFRVAAPNRVWASDVTYIWTREGWLYFAATLDLFSRRVVGWSFGTENDTALVLGALDMAIQTRRPEPGLIFHSDRGSTYASSAFRAELDRHGLIASMSRKGDCWDNAVAESFFASLKGEWLLERGYETIAEAKADLFRYVEEFYNRERLHSTLGYLSPAEFEATTVHV
ncbi:MAG: IS3 family transposase [Gemmatimonadaceae bacterium]